MPKNKFSLNITLIVIVLVAGVLSGITAGSFVALKHDLPQIRKLETFQPSSVSRVFSREGILLTEYYVERRTPVNIEKVPDALIEALITIEDRHFFNHSGIALKGILRAIIKNIIAGGYAEGASTLTQQLAKTLFLSPKKTLVRKIREAILAVQLEKRYTKNEILEFYLNQIYFGSGAYGVSSAADTFFGKPLNALTLSECALLAAMPRSPSRYSPLVNPDLAVERRNLVLKLMANTHKIDTETYLLAKEEPLKLSAHGKIKSKAPYFTQYIKKDLETITGSDNLYRKGYNIYTTLSLDLQKTADASVQANLDRLTKEIQRKGIDTQGLQSAVVSIDVATGGILCMTGGNDFSQTQFNRVTSAKRQPGSSFKPFVYACAIQEGYEQNSLISDSPVSFKGAGGTNWTPQNYSKTYMGEMTMRKALALSKNIPAVRTIDMLSPGKVVNFAYSLGIQSPLAPNLSLALGTSETTLLEMTAAYCVFPNRGTRIKPFAIQRIDNKDGKTIYRNSPDKNKVLSRETAAIMSDMLRGVILEGTGRRARTIDRPIAGKTGTTDHFKDALFLGFSPSVATGVWTGFDDNNPMGPGATGASAALPVWIDVMQVALEKTPPGYFDIPDTTHFRWINPVTGAYTKNDQGVKALFRKNAQRTF